MDHYMPEIFWHDRKGLLSVDLHRHIKNNRYKIVTSSVQKEVRIWEFDFEEHENNQASELTVSFIANLVFHNQAVNCVRFSPNEEQNLLASGDCEGRITIWRVSDAPAPPPQDDMPPNKENWIRFKILNHNSDVNALCWNPKGTHIASVSNDNTLAVHDALTGLRVFSANNFRSPNGVFWDPQGKYIVTMSPDRRMDIVDAAKGTRLKHFSAASLPTRTFQTVNGEIHLEQRVHKLFHDDQLFSFQRSLAFSPNGEFIAAPCAHLEIGSSDLYGTYLFKREDLATKDGPYAFYPCPKPTFLVRFSPRPFKLKESAENHLGLPYRLVWMALHKDGMFFYDSQHTHPIGVVDNITLNALTDANWSPDGKVLLVSSLEGYCSFIKFNLDVWGEVLIDIVPVCASPNMIEEKKKKRKSAAAPATPAVDNAEEGKSPMRKEPVTPKAATPLTKFFKKRETEATPKADTAAAKKAKRVELIKLD